MGEIGIDRREYLYELDYSDIVLITRGYARRHRNSWAATRWQTYYLMSATIGSDAMRKAGIARPADLLRFPWDDEEESGGKDLPSEAEVAELQELMDNINLGC